MLMDTFPFRFSLMKTFLRGNFFPFKITLDKIPFKISLDKIPFKIPLDKIPFKITLDKIPFRAIFSVEVLGFSFYILNSI